MDQEYLVLSAQVPSFQWYPAVQDTQFPPEPATQLAVAAVVHTPS